MKKTEIAAVNELARLVGCGTYKKISHHCTGKWRGTIDHGLEFDNGCHIFISNGMAGFEERAIEYIRKIKTLRENREKYIELLSARIAIDNETAVAEGLQQVKLIDVNVNTGLQDSFLWNYLLLEVGGRHFRHIETSLNYALAQNTLEDYIAGKNRLFTAGAVNKPDYIITNVRFNSKDDLYKIVE